MNEYNVPAVLLSGIVGILLGGVVRAAVSNYASFKEGKGIAAAIRAEIEAIIHVQEFAQHIEAASLVIKRLEEGHSLPTHNDVFTFPISDRPFQVFDSLCHKIGVLGTLGAQVISVYVLGRAITRTSGSCGSYEKGLWRNKSLLDGKPCSITRVKWRGHFRSSKLMADRR